MSKSRKLLAMGSFGLFLFSGVLGYAFVLDCEPLSEQKQYEMERSVFNATHDVSDWSRDFPSYGEWTEMRAGSEDRMHEWISNVFHEVGVQSAETFDPWYERPVQDTSTGHAGIAPENWAKGERD